MLAVCFVFMLLQGVFYIHFPHLIDRGRLALTRCLMSFFFTRGTHYLYIVLLNPGDGAKMFTSGSTDNATVETPLKSSTEPCHTRQAPSRRGKKRAHTIVNSRNGEGLGVGSDNKCHRCVFFVMQQHRQHAGLRPVSDSDFGRQIS